MYHTVICIWVCQNQFSFVSKKKAGELYLNILQNVQYSRLKIVYLNLSDLISIISDQAVEYILYDNSK